MKNILKCDDGVYRWVYELDLLKNPVVFMTVWKVLGIAFGAVWLFVTLISAGDRDFRWAGFLHLLKVFALIFLAASVLAAVAYLIYAAVAGRKYCVLFEMDEEGVKHTQLAKQFEKAKALSELTALVGALAGNTAATGAGMLAGSHSSTYSDFGTLRRVRERRRLGTIKLDHLLTHNQVYAEPEDYAFVRDFIYQHIPVRAKSTPVEKALAKVNEKTGGRFVLTKKKLLALLLALANVVFAVIIACGSCGSDGSDKQSGDQTTSPYTEPTYDFDNFSGFTGDSTTTVPIDPAESTTTETTTTTTAATTTTAPAPTYSAVNPPTLGDFLWFTEDICMSFEPQEGAVAVTDPAAANGWWKCLIYYDPDYQMDSTAMEFCNVYLDGTDDLTCTFKWNVIYFSGESHDRSGDPEGIFSGRWENGKATASGAGAFTLEKIYEWGGRQYAFGRFTPPDGVPSAIALVRP